MNQTMRERIVELLQVEINVSYNMVKPRAEKVADKILGIVKEVLQQYKDITDVIAKLAVVWTSKWEGTKNPLDLFYET